MHNPGLKSIAEKHQTGTGLPSIAQTPFIVLPKRSLKKGISLVTGWKAAGGRNNEKEFRILGFIESQLSLEAVGC